MASLRATSFAKPSQAGYNKVLVIEVYSFKDRKIS